VQVAHLEYKESIMKNRIPLIACTAAIALGAGVSIASAQNTGGPAGPGSSPGNINKSSHYVSPTAQSGAESTTAASGGKIKKNDKAAAEKREKKDIKQTTGSSTQEK
jgi:hypothetical protein